MQDVVLMEQVHGNRVIEVDEKDKGSVIKNCDGLVTKDLNIKLCVRVADCLPIIIKTKDKKTHATVHAGWRGLKKDIIKNAIKLTGKSVKVYMGPHICVDHYEVKDDVAKFFNKTEIKIKRNKKYLDLAKIALSQLTNLGVDKKDVKISKRCTFEDKNLFSYRKNKTDKRNLYYK